VSIQPIDRADYQLTMPDTECWLGIVRACDFLNTIAKRIDHPKRFFVYEAYDYKSVRWYENVVVFADQRVRPCAELVA
jgi:hypothetical protein